MPDLLSPDNLYRVHQSIRMMSQGDTDVLPTFRALRAEVERLTARLAQYEQPDDGEPVTVEWLESIGMRDDESIRFCYGLRLMFHEYGDSRGLVLLLNGELLPSATTRGQVRRLIAALKGEP